MPKCLRCGAGAEWIEGRVKARPVDEDLEVRLVETERLLAQAVDLIERAEYFVQAEEWFVLLKEFNPPRLKGSTEEDLKVHDDGLIDASKVSVVRPLEPRKGGSTARKTPGAAAAALRRKPKVDLDELGLHFPTEDSPPDSADATTDPTAK